MTTQVILILEAILAVFLIILVALGWTASDQEYSADDVKFSYIFYFLALALGVFMIVFFVKMI